MTPKEILQKKPFRRMRPLVYNPVQLIRDGQTVEVGLPANQYIQVTQEQMLSELDPSGHAICLKPEKAIYNKQGTLLDYKKTSKIAINLQEIISLKQKIHLSANPIKWTLTEIDITDEKERYFNVLKQAWIDKNMHVATAECIDSDLKTGDAALYFFMDSEKKLGWKRFSFLDGDVLLPHYDKYGELEIFGRLYRSVEGEKEIAKLEIYDKFAITTYKSSGLTEWTQAGVPEKHSWGVVPVCYKRSNDSCWGKVQPLIDELEEAVSSMSENNKYYANMILFIKGDVADLPDRDGAGKVLTGGPDADAKFLATTESNSAQMNEIDFLLKQIFMGSFTVSISPDTVKSSGDLPGITVKLLFSAAIEKAIDSAKEWDSFIDRAVKLFKKGYGIEITKSAEVENLKCTGEIDIYVPQNLAETIKNINDSVLYKSLSKRTAREINPLSKNGENEKAKEEEQEEIQAQNAASFNKEQI
jgi:hypothetical protein